MIIIPAIDLLDNEAVRLLKGEYAQKTVYSSEPWELVKGFKKTGAQLVHLVDLNGARNASPVNQETIQKIRASAPEIKIQLGGGIRDMDRLRFYEKMGIDRFIIGTAAVLNPEFLKEALDFVGKDRILVSVDAMDGIVKISGWEEKTKIHYRDFLKQMESLGVEQIVFTDIALDGTLKGPNINSYKEILNEFQFQLIASGGISSLKDILALSLLDTKRSISGIITGKAIYEGKLDLGEAIAEVGKLN
jgi:phosphoribosylformimino-5-aminoimidazole carboxamide ribotide isomerase